VALPFRAIGRPLAGIAVLVIVSAVSELHGQGLLESGRERRFDPPGALGATRIWWPPVWRLGEQGLQVETLYSRGDRWVARDKAQHLGWSLAGTLAAAAAFSSLGMAECDCGPWAGGSILSLGIFKEIAVDMNRPGSRSSWQDVVANLTGVIGGWLIWEATHD
jgi:uncharacterized protein YfiM (DUF2279 family)